jgi:hypothetical protein
MLYCDMVRFFFKVDTTTALFMSIILEIVSRRLSSFRLQTTPPPQKCRTRQSQILFSAQSSQAENAVAVSSLAATTHTVTTTSSGHLVSLGLCASRFGLDPLQNRFA